MMHCRKIYNTLLLLSIVLFSLSSALHPLLHEDSANHPLTQLHDCRLDHAGVASATWGKVAHNATHFGQHRFCCPLCSGIGTIAETGSLSPQLFCEVARVLSSATPQAPDLPELPASHEARAPPQSC